ncbi:hypothetical protein EUTSA_v10028540mg [Eutrema salsugineum]|uniref:Uncharacterized protein n=1 Tax=Eutrema salsugineum TaxID=72664 RepID=V4KLG1_EUTSA|nr:uncharacterized protein LOC18014691 [Eutrema salsugineum]ESQ38745.1 hypothetical protein EUTSA_v10028540mg [Eutrema salsugineum]
MEKREPSLVPEWLRSTGHGSGVGSKNHILSSSSRSDSSLSHNSKSRNSRSKSDVDSARSPFLDRSSSTNARRGFSNGSTKNAYSSFNVNRSHRDKDRSREKDTWSYMDPWDNDNPLDAFLIGRDQEKLRRSQSMTTRKQGDHLPQRLTVGLKNGGNNKFYNGGGILPLTSLAKTSKKTGFERDFPSLRAEERNGGPDVVRISSAGLSPAVQSLSVGNSGLIVGEGWTSALAEVPNVIEKSGSGSQAHVGTTGTLTGPTCRNMAEALVQAPARTGTPPQGSAKIQRLEDRARQLIPVVPSAPKGSILNSSDKSKAKPIVRSGEIGLASSRNTHQQSSMLLGNLHSNPGSQIKPDPIKKLVVLKPARENGVSAVKESGSPSRVINSGAGANQTTAAPSTQFTASVRREPREASVMLAGKTAEKKLSLAQTQSRNAFYSALKKKTSTNISTDPSKTNSIFSSVEEKANRSKELVASESPSAQAVERNDIVMEKVDKVSGVAESNSCFESADRPDEKEAEFLKSLGWDENNTEEDEALTEEEIRAFIEQCKKFKPSLVQKLPIIQEATGDVTPNS